MMSLRSHSLACRTSEFLRSRKTEGVWRHAQDCCHQDLSGPSSIGPGWSGSISDFSLTANG